MKRILILTLCLLSLLSLAACGAKETETPVSLTLTNTLPDDKYAVDALGAFADAVWEATDESVTVTVQEGSEASALEALRAGTIDMTVLSYETMCALREEWKAYSMPYLFLHCVEGDQEPRGSAGPAHRLCQARTGAGPSERARRRMRADGL